MAAPAPDNPKRFPTLATLGALSAAAVVVGLAADAVTASVAPESRVAVASAVAVVWAAGAASLWPIALFAPHGPQPAGSAFMATIAARMVICLGAALVAVLGLGVSRTGFLLGLLAAYPPLLAVEVFMMSWFMRKAFGAPGAARPADAPDPGRRVSEVSA